MKLVKKKVAVLSKAEMKKVKCGQGDELCISQCMIGYHDDPNRGIWCERQCTLEQTT